MIGGEPPFDLLRRDRRALRRRRHAGRTPRRRARRRRRSGERRARRLAGLVAALALLGAGALRAQDSPHGDLAIACQECHTTASWVPVERDIAVQARVGRAIPLVGMHAVAACAECHTSKVFSRVATACQDCHTDAHAGELGVACSDCHDPRRWDSRDDLYRAHDKTLFPLHGGHARVDCEACHGGQPPEQYKLTPTDCIACHRADFQGATDRRRTADSRSTCQQCHLGVPDDWRAAAFNHSARFPLAGAHAGVACADCHRNGYRGTAGGLLLLPSRRLRGDPRSQPRRRRASRPPARAATAPRPGSRRASTTPRPASRSRARTATIACADCHTQRLHRHAGRLLLLPPRRLRRARASRTTPRPATRPPARTATR